MSRETKTRRTFELSDKQFEGLEASTRRALMEQLMILDTPRYRYSLGAKANLWTLNRYDRMQCIGRNEWEEDYEPLEVDSWD